MRAKNNYKFVEPIPEKKMPEANPITPLKSANPCEAKNRVTKHISRTKTEIPESEPVRNCKQATPKPGPSKNIGNNGYIKLQAAKLNSQKKAVELQNLEGISTPKSYTTEPTVQFFSSCKKEKAVTDSETTECLKKKPKFVRTNCTKNEEIGVSPRVLTEPLFVEPVLNYNELLQQNNCLKKRNNELENFLKQYQYKLNLTEQRIVSLENQLQQRTKKIEQLSQQVVINRDVKEQVVQQLEDIMGETDIFKGINSLNLDDIGLGLDLVQTTEYLENMNDLEQQLHRKNAQIFELKKAVQQLKIKQHFAEARSAQKLQRNNQQWQIKYKRILNMYKALKSNKGAISNKMNKAKTKTQYLEEWKQDSFNLSLSTDRSQIPIM